MKSNSMIKKNEAVSAELDEQVAAFLANGGSVKTYDDCTVDEAMHKSRKPYKRVDKNGKVSFVRVSEHHINLSAVGHKVGYGHSSR